MSKRERPPRPKAALPRGLRDAAGEEVRALTRMLARIGEVYEAYGFEPLATPALEFTEALGKFLPDEDRPNEGVFSLQDEDERWLSLRYDLTAPLARYVAENYDRLPKPFRRYQWGPVWRNEKPGPGRYREFLQIDADTVGTKSPAADAEMCMLAADALEALGLRGNYVIRVNDRKILDGVIEAIGVTDPRQHLTVMRAIDKQDRLGIDGVRALLGKGRKDESGDFTKGAELSEKQIKRVSDFLFAEGIRHYEPLDQLPYPVANDEDVNEGGWAYSNLNTLTGLSDFFDSTPSGETAISELEAIFTVLPQCGYGSKRIRIDPSVVRGLEYYTGPVFEAELTFETVGEDGRPVRFGSVGGGGRYDGLVARFRGQEVPATGFSVGVSRLYAALEHLGRHEAERTPAPVVILAMDAKAMAGYQRMARELREAGIRAEVYLGTSGMGAQMKYADRRGAPCVVIEGTVEREQGVVTIKDLIEGKRISGEIEGRAEWTAQPTQGEVPRDGLVEAVTSILARHGFARKPGAAP